MRIRLASILVVVAALGLATAGKADASLLAPTSRCEGQTDLSASVDQQEYTLRCLINYARAQTGRHYLRKSDRLQTSSDLKAKDILDCQSFSHTACGRTWYYWMQWVGFYVGCAGVGENIAWGSGSLGTARATMSRWLNSDTHRHVLLGRKYRRQGIGMRRGSLFGYSGVQVWVAHLGYHC